MKYPIYITIMILIFSSCEKTKTKGEIQKIKNYSNVSDDTSKTKIENEKLTTFDSLEKVNNNIINASNDNIAKATVFLKTGDSTINLYSNINKEYKFFGYAKPNVNSERLILFSVFTNDVENNPFGCKFGAFYETSGIDNLKLKYISTNGNFVNAKIINNSNISTNVFFEKKWINIE